jgi:hypothetical protein
MHKGSTADHRFRQGCCTRYLTLEITKTHQGKEKKKSKVAGEELLKGIEGKAATGRTCTPGASAGGLASLPSQFLLYQQFEAAPVALAQSALCCSVVAWGIPRTHGMNDFPAGTRTT